MIRILGVQPLRAWTIAACVVNLPHPAWCVRPTAFSNGTDLVTDAGTADGAQNSDVVQRRSANASKDGHDLVALELGSDSKTGFKDRSRCCRCGPRRKKPWDTVIWSWSGECNTQCARYYNARADATPRFLADKNCNPSDHRLLNRKQKLDCRDLCVETFKFYCDPQDPQVCQMPPADEAYNREWNKVMGGAGRFEGRLEEEILDLRIRKREGVGKRTGAGGGTRSGSSKGSGRPRGSQQGSPTRQKEPKKEKRVEEHCEPPNLVNYCARGTERITTTKTGKGGEEEQITMCCPVEKGCKRNYWYQYSCDEGYEKNDDGHLCCPVKESSGQCPTATEKKCQGWFSTCYWTSNTTCVKGVCRCDEGLCYNKEKQKCKEDFDNEDAEEIHGDDD